MKITIAYLPEEEREASVIESFVKCLVPGIKLRKSENHAPFKHIYMAAKKPESRCGSEENA